MAPLQKQTTTYHDTSQEKYANRHHQEESATLSDDYIRKEFNILDKNKTGYIDKKDLQKAFGSKVPKQLISMAIKYADKDKDGKIGYEEYKQIRMKFKDIKIPGL